MSDKEHAGDVDTAPCLATESQNNESEETLIEKSTNSESSVMDTRLDEVNLIEPPAPFQPLQVSFPGNDDASQESLVSEVASEDTKATTDNEDSVDPVEGDTTEGVASDSEDKTLDNKSVGNVEDTTMDDQSIDDIEKPSLVDKQAVVDMEMNTSVDDQSISLIEKPAAASKPTDLSQDVLSNDSQDNQSSSEINIHINSHDTSNNIVNDSESSTTQADNMDIDDNISAQSPDIGAGDNVKVTETAMDSEDVLLQDDNVKVEETAMDSEDVLLQDDNVKVTETAMDSEDVLLQDDIVKEEKLDVPDTAEVNGSNDGEMQLKIVGVTSAVGMEDLIQEEDKEKSNVEGVTGAATSPDDPVVIDEADRTDYTEDDKDSDSGLGIQITAVTTAADMPTDIKEEDKDSVVAEDPKKEEADVKTKEETKPTAVVDDDDDDDDVIAVKEEKLPVQKPTSQKSSASKIQTCIVCQKITKCKYNIVRNGDIKHLCDDVCFKQFRSNPTTFLRQSEHTTNGTSTPTQKTTAKEATKQDTVPSASAENNQLPQTFKTCSVCQLMNIRTSKPFLSWQGLDFCGEECLGKFQNSLSPNCGYCGLKVSMAVKAKFCFKVGADVKQFCSGTCHTEYCKRLKICAYCNTDLKALKDSFMAPVGNQGVFKDFCSQACLLKYEDKNNKEVEIVAIQKGEKAAVAPKGNFQCAVCSKVGPVKHEYKMEGNLNRFCSDPCFSAFQYTNKLTLNNCDNCSSECFNDSRQAQYVQFEGHQKHFCSFMCIHSFREANKKMVSCSWCGTKKTNFDMIERVDANSKYQLFCSLNCLSLYRVNLQATSNQAVMCDQCRKFVPAQYHLTMSDASVRNFCCYSCVMTFQSQFTQPSKAGQKTSVNQPAAPTPQPQIKTQTPPQLTTRYGRPVVNRGMQQKQVTPPTKPVKTTNNKQQSPGSFPIISNVVSLAPQGGKQQQINLKTPANVPVVVTGGQQQNIKTTTSTSTQGTVQQQIIIQPPPPKSVKNKAMVCKPVVQTKATSCRPHTQTKNTQTEEELIKTVHHFIPFPVPIYVPTPLAMYTTPTPLPLAIPIPIPVPIFIPTTKKSAASILKQIKEIREKMPSDPLEAELLMMAEAIGGKQSDSDSEPDQEEEEAVTKPEKDVNTETAAEPEKQTTKTTTTTTPAASGSLGEDMLQMALRMATEMSTEPVMDLEASLEPVAVNRARPAASDPDVVDEETYVPPKNLRRGAKKRASSGRATRRTSKRQRTESSTEAETQEQSSPVQVAPPADANFHLKYTYGVNAWKHWVIQKNAQLEHVSKMGSGKPLKTFKTDILQCTADELNFSLCLFVKEVRKPNREEYAVDSIYYLCLGIQQYIFENGRIDNIFTDVYCEKFTECLNEILQRYEPKLNTQGQLVCRIEEEHLWESKQLGAHSPHVLLNSLVYFNTKYFMLKTSEDHLKLSFTHIMKHWKKTLSGRGSGTGANAGRSVYLRYFAPGSQTADGNQKKKKEELPVYEQCENLDNPLRCPVKLYEFYLSKCSGCSSPESIKNRNDAFYMVPERSCVPDSPVWYSTQMMGIDQMAKMLNRIRLVREIQEAHLHTQPSYI